MARFVCDRCKTTWDQDEARCPQCLRKTSVRDTEGPSSEAARLASGDHGQTEGARRATALLLAVGAIIALGVGVSLAWSTLVPLRGPMFFAWSVAGAWWLGAALMGAPSWAVLARRAAFGCGLGAWALVSSSFAIVSASDLSPLFTVGIAGILFGAGVIAVLGRKQSRQEPPKPASGKWR